MVLQRCRGRLCSRNPVNVCFSTIAGKLCGCLAINCWKTAPVVLVSYTTELDSSCMNSGTLNHPRAGRKSRLDWDSGLNHCLRQTTLSSAADKWRLHRTLNHPKVKCTCWREEGQAVTFSRQNNPGDYTDVLPVRGMLLKPSTASMDKPDFYFSRAQTDNDQKEEAATTAQVNTRHQSVK